MEAFSFVHLIGPRRPARANKNTRRPAIVDWPAGKTTSSTAAERLISAEDRELEELNGSDLIAQARRRERARCAAIFNHPAPALNFSLTATLAFDTEQTRQEALAFLDSVGASAEAQAANRSRAMGNASLPQVR